MVAIYYYVKYYISSNTGIIGIFFIEYLFGGRFKIRQVEEFEVTVRNPLGDESRRPS